ncbi:MAG: hypothetical protein AAFY41_00750 [Bacteroidota bacterium]
MKSLKDHIVEMDQMVLAATELSQEELAKIKFEYAYAYLEHVIGTDAYGLEHLPQSPVFWGHWKRIWYEIDRYLFEGEEDQEAVFKLDLSTGLWMEHNVYGWDLVPDMLSSYINHHKVTMMGWQLNSAVLQEGWHQTIKKIAKPKPTQ